MSSLLRAQLRCTRSLRKLSTISHKTPQVDILVNGGGIVGLTFIASLAKSPHFEGKHIVLLEQQDAPKKEKVMPIQSERILSNRVSSLTTSSKALLEQLGLWKELEKFVKKAHRMHVWAESFSRGITFEASESHRKNCPWDAPDDDAVCYFVENNILQDALLTVIPDNWIRYQCKASDIKDDDGNLMVTLDHSTGQESISTSLLVGCDGFKSLVRSKSNLEYREFDWHESAVVATVEMDVKSDQDDNSIAYQRFLPEDGSVIALLPLTQFHSSLVLSTSRDKAHRLLNLEEEIFVDQLNNLLFKPSKVSSSVPEPFSTLFSSLDSAANNLSSIILPKSKLFSSTLGNDIPQVRSIVPGSRGSFPLFFGTTFPYMSGSLKGSKLHKIALIGDSSHRIPPLAGQGLNLGIGDAIELASSLNHAASRGENLFSNQPESQECLSHVLREFERRRMLKLLPILSSVATMQKVFQFTPSPLLSIFNQLPQLKNLAVRLANSR